jgi:hypothetical protein
MSLFSYYRVPQACGLREVKMDGGKRREVNKKLSKDKRKLKRQHRIGQWTVNRKIQKRDPGQRDKWGLWFGMFWHFPLEKYIFSASTTLRPERFTRIPTGPPVNQFVLDCTYIACSKESWNYNIGLFFGH